MAELISVIIPVYRVEAYLRRCVDSVLASDYESFEVILVDDGSDDGCPAICDEYAAADKRVRVIHQENAGLSGARNAGIDEAKGDFIAFADSDDYLSKSFLSKLYRACRETDAQVGICRWEYVRGEEIPENGSGEAYVYSGREALGRLYDPDGAYFVVAWNKLYRREFFDGIRYPLGRIHEDEATTYRIFDRAERIVYLDESLYGYFVAQKSITRGFNPGRMDWVSAQKERIDYFEEKGYHELMVPACRAAADGAIDICFGLRDHMKDSEKQQEEIKALVRDIQKRVRRYGGLPLRTRIGYRLFLICPRLYRKLLDVVKEENGKQ